MKTKLNDLEEVKIKIKGNGILDVASNTVSISENKHYNALYIYREMPLQIQYANLMNILQPPGRDPVTNTTIYESKELRISPDAGYKFNNMKIYYAVVNTLNTTPLTPYQIINATDTISQLYGSYVLESTSDVITFNVAQSNKPNSSFKANQIIYFVVTDDYGNVSNVVNKTISYTPSP